MATTTTTLSDEATKAVDEIEETTRGVQNNIAEAADAVRTAANEVALRIGGANRLLVAAALVPVAAMGLTLLGRANGRSRGSAKTN